MFDFREEKTYTYINRIAVLNGNGDASTPPPYQLHERPHVMANPILPQDPESTQDSKSLEWYVEDVSHIIQSEWCFVLRSPDGEPQWFGRTEAEAWSFAPADAQHADTEQPGAAEGGE